MAGAKPDANSQTSTGAAAIPTIQVTSSAQASTVATASTSKRVASSPSALRVAASNGTKACEKAPSANKRRNRLGMRKAIWNASIIAEVPNIAAPICSRTSPVMRDNSVSAETENAALNRFMRACGPDRQGLQSDGTRTHYRNASSQCLA